MPSQPPLGRPPSAPHARSPSYPLARTPGTATSGTLTAAQLASAKINSHFSPKRPQRSSEEPRAELSRADSDRAEANRADSRRIAVPSRPPPVLPYSSAPQQTSSTQQRRSGDFATSYQQAPQPVANNGQRGHVPAPQLAPPVALATPAFRFPAGLQPTSEIVPAPMQNLHRSEASLQDLPIPNRTRATPSQPARHRSASLSIATTTPPERQPGAPSVARSGSLSDSLSFAPAGSGQLGSPAPGSLVVGSGVIGSLVVGSDSHSGSKDSMRAGSTAASWVHSQSAQQLTANVKTLAAQVSSRVSAKRLCRLVQHSGIACIIVSTFIIKFSWKHFCFGLKLEQTSWCTACVVQAGACVMNSCSLLAGYLLVYCTLICMNSAIMCALSASSAELMW